MDRLGRAKDILRKAWHEAPSFLGESVLFPSQGTKKRLDTLRESTRLAEREYQIADAANKEAARIAWEQAKEQEMAARGGRYLSDWASDGTRNKVWLYNAPQAITSIAGKASLLSEGYSPLVAGLAGVGLTQVMELTSGNIDLTNLDQAGRPKGYSVLFPEERPEIDPETGKIRYVSNPMKSENPIAEIGARYFLNRSGRILPEEQFLAERPDVTPEEYARFRAAKNSETFFGLEDLPLTTTMPVGGILGNIAAARGGRNRILGTVIGAAASVPLKQVLIDIPAELRVIHGTTETPNDPVGEVEFLGYRLPIKAIAATALAGAGMKYGGRWLWNKRNQVPKSLVDMEEVGAPQQMTLWKDYDQFLNDEVVRYGETPIKPPIQPYYSKGVNYVEPPPVSPSIREMEGIVRSIEYRAQNDPSSITLGDRQVYNNYAEIVGRELLGTNKSGFGKQFNIFGGTDETALNRFSQRTNLPTLEQKQSIVRGIEARLRQNPYRITAGDKLQYNAYAQELGKEPLVDNGKQLNLMGGSEGTALNRFVNNGPPPVSLTQQQKENMLRGIEARARQNPHSISVGDKQNYNAYARELNRQPLTDNPEGFGRQLNVFGGGDSTILSRFVQGAPDSFDKMNDVNRQGFSRDDAKFYRYRGLMNSDKPLNFAEQQFLKDHQGFYQDELERRRRPKPDNSNIREDNMIQLNQPQSVSSSQAEVMNAYMSTGNGENMMDWANRPGNERYKAIVSQLINDIPMNGF